MEAQANKIRSMAIAVAVAVCVTSGLAHGAQGGGGGRGGGQGAPGQPEAPTAPARGTTINANPIQKAHAEYAQGPAGNTDADTNHPFHSDDLPNINGAAAGPTTLTTYTTRFNLGDPLSLFDADGSAIVIHAKPDTYSTGPQGSCVGGGAKIACGVIVK